jgi:hypothetical protein
MALSKLTMAYIYFSDSYTEVDIGIGTSSHGIVKVSNGMSDLSAWHCQNQQWHVRLFGMALSKLAMVCLAFRHGIVKVSNGISGSSAWHCQS